MCTCLDADAGKTSFQLSAHSGRMKGSRNNPGIWHGMIGHSLWLKRAGTAQP